MAGRYFSGVTNWLYTTRQSDEGGQTSNWCLACFSIGSFSAGLWPATSSASLPRKEDVSLYPPNSGSMLGQHRIPLLVQCRSIVYDAGPTLIHHWVCCILCANTWHSPNAVSLFTHSLRRWSDIETLGNCRPIVFSDCCMGVTICGWCFSFRRQKHQITQYIGPILM